MTELVAQAKRLGVDPGDYSKTLIGDALAFQRAAEDSTFAQVMAPVRDAVGDVDDAEIMKLVEKARANHYAGRRRKKR